MIELTRALARSFRAVLRRSLVEREPRRPWPPVLCRAGAGGLSLESVRIDMALRFHRGRRQPADAVAFGGEVLAAFAGRGDDPVLLEHTAAGRGRARWEGCGEARVVEFEAVPAGDLLPFPDPPAQWAPVPADFMAALAEAVRSAPRGFGPFGRSRIPPRSRRGEVAAADGGGLVLRGGLPLPWAEDLRVVGASAFGRRELAAQTEVLVGRAQNHVAVSAGPWTLLLAVDSIARRPGRAAPPA